MMEGNGSVSLLDDSELISEENPSTLTPEAALLSSSASEVVNIVASDKKQNEVKREESKTAVNRIPLEPECVILPKSNDCDSDYERKALSLPSHDSQSEVGMAENGKPETTGTSDNLVPPKPKIPNLQKHIGIRSLVAFWLLGLCNNYGYVVMLSAAHDILGRDYKEHGSVNVTTTTPAPHNARDCNEMSTGAILLADIIPSLVIKMTAPFFPLLIHVRLGLVIILSISGYILVGASTAPWMALSGVVATAFASGLGEASLLSYMAFYKDSDVISTWSSGTGGAGFFGSLSYAFLTSIGISPAMTLYGLSSVPILMAVTFWFILKHPKLNEKELQVESPTSDNTTSAYKYADEVPLHTTEDTFMEKLRYIPHLFQFMIPIGLVYLFEYFINQGLFELVYFKNIWLNHSEQYRWYQVLYQIGVFVSRSSLRLIQIRFLWLLGLLQFVNVILFLIQSVFSAIPSIYVIMVAVFWEGLLGGAAYVNTFHRITVEVPASKREFSMAITSLADALGITLAGITSLPVHNYICKLPDYKL